MSLQTRLLKLKNQQTIEYFKETYPEVYQWFNGDYFANLMLSSDADGISIRAYQIKNRERTYPVGLPIQDSEGIVDMDDIIDYLKAEGFIAYLGSDYVDTKDLMIRLK